MKGKPAAAGRRASKREENGDNGRLLSERQHRRNEETRKRLFEAAAKVVAEHGYAGASISRITAEAKVAHGAFYLHFSSRQQLFDELLPHIGQDMIEQIGKAARNAKTLPEVEARGVAANLRYLDEHQSLFRVMAEAEFFAPETYWDFIDVLYVRYLKSLRRSHADGQVKGFAEEDLEIVVSMLMGARDFLLQRYVKSDKTGVPPIEKLTEVYLRFVLAGLTYGDRISLEDLPSPSKSGDDAP